MRQQDADGTQPVFEVKRRHKGARTGVYPTTGTRLTPMHTTRRSFALQLSSALLAGTTPQMAAPKLVEAARAQIGVTTGYDPAYTRIAFPLGDVPRSTGICADVIVRACRDALGLDLQALVHADMAKNFRAYPHSWGAAHPDTNIDHRRVLNLQTFWTRQQARAWAGSLGGFNAGDDFGPGMRPGDFVTWLIGGLLPHVGIVAEATPERASVVHNIGRGAEETELAAFHAHRAMGRYRWPV